MTFRSILTCACLALAAPAIPCAATPAEAQKARLQKESPDSDGRRELSRVQILLDRASFRPGKIDGLGGEFTQKAADRYCLANALPPGTRFDVSGIPSPYRDYAITPEDSAWVGPQAAGPPAQEKLKAMLYENLWEFVAERFHCDLNFLHELNPAVTAPAPGTILRVPDVGEFQLTEVTALEKQRRGEAAAAQAQPARPARRLALLRDECLIEVYEGDLLLACFPCTPGSKQVPVPAGTWKVTANILLPYFRWDKSVLESGVRSEAAFNLPPGPNNPVGIVWIAINRPSVGMHGTPIPDQIGRNESHGCIRLANWDAFALSQLVEKGTPVAVR